MCISQVSIRKIKSYYWKLIFFPNYTEFKLLYKRKLWGENTKEINNETKSNMLIFFYFS